MSVDSNFKKKSEKNLIDGKLLYLPCRPIPAISPAPPALKYSTPTPPPIASLPGLVYPTRKVSPTIFDLVRPNGFAANTRRDIRWIAVIRLNLALRGFASGSVDWAWPGKQMGGDM